jgi:hypothetical protein
MVKGKLNLALVVIVALGLSACASSEQKTFSSDVPDDVLDVSGIYEIEEVDYSKELPIADRLRFFGSDPDIEFVLSQKGDKIKGEFSGDRDGIVIKGRVDDEEVTFEFTLEAKGGDLKDGNGKLLVQEDGSLKGEFNIRDGRLGIVRGNWTLTKIE